MKMLHFCFCQMLTHNAEVITKTEPKSGRNIRHRNKRKAALSFQNHDSFSAGEFVLMKQCQCAASSDVLPHHGGSGSSFYSCDRPLRRLSRFEVY